MPFLSNDHSQITKSRHDASNCTVKGAAAGLTLVELIVTVAILTILSVMALPLARFAIKREKERILRADLRQIREAIDRYKAAADRGSFMIKVDTFGYPPDLDTLTTPMDIQGKKIRFLAYLPKDPMTNSTDWGMRSMEDAPDATSWGGQNVFDVYTKSDGVALDGSRYSGW